MRRVVIFVAICFALAGSAFGSIDYPTLGMCTGNNVRLRDNPGTDSNVIGKANDFDIFVVLGERRVKGDMWYVIDHPTEQGEAWISGQYLDLNKGDSFGTVAFTMGVSVRKTYGLRPAKARALFGKPKRSRREKFFFDPAQRNLTEETLNYEGFTLRYIEDRLRCVEVTRKGHAFGELEVGKPRHLVVDVLGMPAEASDTMSYEVSPIETLTFTCSNDVIISMTWEESLDG